MLIFHFLYNLHVNINQLNLYKLHKVINLNNLYINLNYLIF